MADGAESRIIINFYRSMEESSFLSNSSTLKRRKPIFPKDQSSPVNKLALTSQPSRTHSLHHASLPQPSRPTSSIQTTNQNIPSNPLRISFSQSKPVHAPTQHVIYNSRPAPVLTRSVAPQNAYPQTVHLTQYHPPQNAFYQTVQAPSHTRSSHHLYQTQPIRERSRVQSKENTERNGNSGMNLKPTVVAIERVMKEVGSNLFEKQITYLPQEEGECEPAIRVTPPTCPTPAASPCGAPSESFRSVVRACGPQVQVERVLEINSLLSENYNMLYNQFFSLKRDIKEEEVVEERAFLQRSAAQIDAIFSLQTAHALSQIEQLFQTTKTPLKKAYRPRADFKPAIAHSPY